MDTGAAERMRRYRARQRGEYAPMRMRGRLRKGQLARPIIVPPPPPPLPPPPAEWLTFDELAPRGVVRAWLDGLVIKRKVQKNPQGDYRRVDVDREIAADPEQKRR